MYTKSVPQKRKLTVKGGVAVDPDSGKEVFIVLINLKNKDTTFPTFFMISHIFLKCEDEMHTLFLLTLVL